MSAPQYIVIPALKWTMGRVTENPESLVDWIIASWEGLSSETQAEIHEYLFYKFEADDQFRLSDNDGPMGTRSDKEHWQRLYEHILYSRWETAPELIDSVSVNQTSSFTPINRCQLIKSQTLALSDSK